MTLLREMVIIFASYPETPSDLLLNLFIKLEFAFLWSRHELVVLLPRLVAEPYTRVLDSDFIEPTEWNLPINFQSCWAVRGESRNSRGE